MNNTKEIQKVQRYFKTHPEQVKYSRKESGLSSSYLRTPENHIIRLYNKTELDTIVGSGGYGKVKKTESDAQSTVTKIQRFNINPEDADGLEYIRTQAEQEALTNLDFGIAKGSLTERKTASKDNLAVIFYQEMYPLKETLHARIPLLNAEQRMKTAIELLLLVDDCHTGALTRSGMRYMHGDISDKNVMYDAQGKLKLIDFGLSEQLTKIKQLKEDQKYLLKTIFDVDGLLFSGEDTSKHPKLPFHILKMVSWIEYNQVDIDPEQYLTFITAIMITLDKHPNLTIKEVDSLRVNPYEQIMIVEQYKREQAILQIPDAQAQTLLNGMISTLQRYQRFLERRCTQESEPTEIRLILEHKRNIIENILDSTRVHPEQSPQALLANIDKELVIYETILSQSTCRASKGVVGYILSQINNFSGDVSIASMTHKIDAQIRDTHDKFKRAAHDHRSRATTSSSITEDSDDDSTKSEEHPKKSS